jgi:hypothetical protein
MVFGEDVIDYSPGCIHRVFACKEAPIPNHGVVKEPLVRRFTPEVLFDQAELALIADKFLARKLDPGRNGNGGNGRQSEA